MAYIVGQQNQQEKIYNLDPRSQDGDYVSKMYADPSDTIVGTTRVIDYNVAGQSIFAYVDQFIKISNPTSFNPKSSYYCHAKIKRLDSDQIFKIKLINVNNNNEMVGTQSQQIKDIKVAKTNNDTTLFDINNFYVDVDFVFTPQDNTSFNSIVFELIRTNDDNIQSSSGSVVGRNPKIGFMELSLIDNKKPVNTNISLIKLGIQSRPNLMTCINGEEIHLPRSGVFEIRDGIIKVDFFSVVSPAEPKDGTTQLSDQMSSDEGTMSLMIYKNNMKRKIPAFTLDYLYES